MTLASPNGGALEPARWTRRRWLYTVLAVFVLQAALLFWLGQRAPPPVPPPPFRTAIHLAADAWSAEQLANLPALRDPALFALPHPRGFSGSAWRTLPPPAHRQTEWTEPPRWLALDPARLGAVFAGFVSTNATAPLLIADKPTPRLAGLDPVVPNVPVLERTEILVEGELARRPLLTPLAAPSWPHTNALAPTVVRLLVGAEGQAVSSVLLAPSGLREADQFALGAADHARFQALLPADGTPADAARLAWGQLIFRWHTVPPPATNAAGAP